MPSIAMMMFLEPFKAAAAEWADGAGVAGRVLGEAGAAGFFEWDDGGGAAAAEAVYGFGASGG